MSDPYADEPIHRYDFRLTGDCIIPFIYRVAADGHLRRAYVAKEDRDRAAMYGITLTALVGIGTAYQQGHNRGLTPPTDAARDPSRDLAGELEAIASEMVSDLRPVTGACRMLDDLVGRIRAVAAQLKG